MENKILETPNFDVEIKNGILFAKYKSKITLEIAKASVKARMELTLGKPLPVFIQMSDVKSADKDARDFFSSDEGTKGVKAGAIFVDSVFYSFLGNFFLQVTKPKIPAKLFTDKEKAIKWLEQYK